MFQLTCRLIPSGFYKDADVASLIRKFGYADKNDKPDRLNFGGGAQPPRLHRFAPSRTGPRVRRGRRPQRVGRACSPTVTRCDWRRARIRCGCCGRSLRARCITIRASSWKTHPPTRQSPRSEASFAWRPETSTRFTRRWRRWRCELPRENAKNAEERGGHAASPCECIGA